MPRIIADGQPAGAGGGLVTGDITYQIPFVQDWTTHGGPSAGTKGNFDTLDFADGVDRGVRFNFQVPDDYDSGDLELRFTYALVTGTGGNIALNWAANIITLATGTIDTASYPAATSVITLPGVTTIQRSAFAFSCSISAGDFAAGDTIQYFVARFGSSGSDTLSDTWQLVALDITYTGQVATRAAVQVVELFADTDETPPSSGTKGNFDTLDFPTGVDREQKFMFHVPGHWDEASDAQIRVTYAMTTSSASPIKLETEGSIADISAGSTVAVPVSPWIYTTSSDQNIHRSVIISSIPAEDLGKGDSIVLKLARRGSSGDDTHGGDFQLISLTVVFGVAPRNGFEAVLVSEQYLYQPDWSVAAGSPSGQQLSATIGSENETWLVGTGSAPGDQIQLRFQGRLGDGQTQITQIKIPHKYATGSPTCQCQIYADGSGGSPVYNSAITLGTSRALLTLTDTDLSAQPTGEKRYFIVLWMTLAASENVYIGFPFVKQE